MSKFFNGFEGFDCREEIWYGIFRAKESTMELRKVLCLPDEGLDAPVLSKKLKGTTPWTTEPVKFFSFSEDPRAYRQNWEAQWASPPGCLDVFRRFIASVPDMAPSSEQARFLPNARKVCGYLEKVLLHCSSNSTDTEKWVIAGMYVLVSFFLQNSTATKHRFYCPPRECDPVLHSETEPMIVPEIVMLQPEDNIHAVDTEKSSNLNPEPRCSIHTSCRICQSEELFYDDPMLRWKKRAYGFAYACRALAVATTSVFSLFGVLHSILAEYCPSLAASVYRWIECMIPRFYSGFSDGSELILSVCVSGLFLGVSLVLLSVRFLKQANVYHLLELEKDYRWIAYECRECSAKYKDKVFLRDLSVDDDEPSAAACGAIQFIAILLSAVFLGSLLLEILSPTDYWAIPFLSLFLPVLFLKSHIGSKLLEHLHCVPHSDHMRTLDEWLHEVYVLYKYGEDAAEDIDSEETELETYAEE